MSTKSRAEELADYLEADMSLTGLCNEAAAELRRLAAECSSLRSEVSSLRSDVEALRESVERTKADAGRYQWLRDGSNPEALSTIGAFGGDDLDAAIDAAMKASHD